LKSFNSLMSTFQKYLNWTVLIDLMDHIFNTNKITFRKGRRRSASFTPWLTRTHIGMMHLTPNGSDGRKTPFQHLLSCLSEDIQHRTNIYLMTRLIERVVKFGVVEKKQKA